MPSSSSASAALIDGISNVRKALTLAAESVPVPQSFRCPLTLEIMKDAVVTVDGQVYERSAIQEWFQRGHNTSPSTGLALPSLVLLPDAPLQRAIEEYLRSRPELVRKELDLLSLQAIAETLENERQAKDARIVNPQEPADIPQPSLLEMAQRADVPRCLELLAQMDYMGINEKDRFGRTALHFCAEKDLRAVAFALLARADFKESYAEATLDGCNWTALELAVAKGHEQLAAGINAFLLGSATPRNESKLLLWMVAIIARECGTRGHSKDIIMCAEWVHTLIGNDARFLNLSDYERESVLSGFTSALNDVQDAGRYRFREVITGHLRSMIGGSLIRSLAGVANVRTRCMRESSSGRERSRSRGRRGRHVSIEDEDL